MTTSNAHAPQITTTLPGPDVDAIARGVDEGGAGSDPVRQQVMPSYDIVWSRTWLRLGLVAGLALVVLATFVVVTHARRFGS